MRKKKFDTHISPRLSEISQARCRGATKKEIAELLGISLATLTRAQRENEESAEKLQSSRKQLERNERRIMELKRLFIKIYEDNAKGKLNDERFELMSQNYEAEQKQLEAEVITLKQEIEVQERQNENIERFIRTADKYVNIEEIDPCMLRELIKAIYVEAPDKSSGKRRQNIHIEYDGIGFIPLDELAKKETA